MANNPNVNKVEYAGRVLMDLTGDTATAADVAQGKTFHDATGALVVGTATGGGALKILATAPTGSTVTARKDGSTYNGVEDARNPGSYTVSVPEYGTYTVTAAYNGSTKTKNVTVTEESTSFDFVVPSGYTELEYIESTGTQYINTEIIAQPTTGCEGKFALTQLTPPQTNAQVIIGSWYPTPFSLMGSYSGKFFSQFSDNASTILFGPSHDINDHVFSSNINGNASFTINGSTYGQSTYFGQMQNGALWLFSRNYNGSTNASAAAKIYYMRIYNNDTLVRNFIPAKRDSDDVIGMYDNVSNQFFTNAGAGTFIAGPEVT